MSTPNSITGKDIYDHLTTGISFPLPPINWNDPKWNIDFDPNEPPWNKIKKIDLKDLTEGKLDGKGVFDVVMASLKEHLREEYKNNRITGAEYSKVYLGSIESALANSVNFLVQQEDAFWKALAARFAAMQSIHEIELAKIRYAELYMSESNLKADFANKVLGLANINESTTTEVYNHSQMLPAQRSKVISETALDSYTLSDMLPAQKNKILAETSIDSYTLSDMLPAQKGKVLSETALDGYNLNSMLPQQRLLLVEQTATEKYNNLTMLPAQKLMIDEQRKTEAYNNTHMLPANKKLTDEQMEATRAQTLDNRTDGSTVVGLLGKQKELYSQQITAYKRDSEVKAAKLFLDQYMTRFTILDGVGMIPAASDTVVATVMTNVKNAAGI